MSVRKVGNPMKYTMARMATGRDQYRRAKL